MEFISCCYSRRKDLRRVWSLPYNTHTALLAPLSDSIPLMDELCRRTLSFMEDCLSCNCNLASVVSRQAVNCGRVFSSTGCNVLFCCERYQQVVTLHNLFNCSPSPNAIRNYCISQVSDDLRTTVLRLLELIMLRDNVMFLSDSEFNKNEFCDLINLICIS